MVLFFLGGNEDYEDWVAHEGGKNNGCLLGKKVTFRRLKKQSLWVKERKKVSDKYCNVPWYPPDWPFWRIQTLTLDGWPTYPDLAMKKGVFSKNVFPLPSVWSKDKIRARFLAPSPLLAPPLNLLLWRTWLNCDTLLRKQKNLLEWQVESREFLGVANPLLVLYCVVVLFRRFSISCFTSFLDCTIHNIKKGVRQIVFYSCGPGTNVVRGAPRSLTVFSVHKM